MLFDLQGPRKTMVKVVYLGLAILMAGGLVLFGIGSNVNGGLADVFGGSDSTSAAKDSVNKYSEQVQANPKNEEALQKLIAARYSLAGDPKNFNQAKGTFSKEGTDQLNQAKKNWLAYNKLTDGKPNLTTANYAVSVYLGLQDAKGATAVQQLVTEKQPNAANYLALMLYASYAGDSLVAAGAEQRARELATKDEKKEVADQIKEIQKQVGERSAAIQKQIQEQFSQQSQQGQPSNPFGGLGGGGANGGVATGTK
jgi:hypothetical protein